MAKNGKIVWQDLTVPNAESIRDFYSTVVGWSWKSESMGSYEDYSMIVPGNSDPVSGICHAKGVNANLPPQWLVYIEVDDVEEAAKKAVTYGGKVLDGPRYMGKNMFCVIQDPAGAVFALIS